MTTVQEQLNELTRQRNTLSLIIQGITRFNREQLRLVTDNTFLLDEDRIENIKDFLQLEADAVQSIIDGLLDDSVSGT